MTPRFSSFELDFTDGDTLKRFTVTDPDVVPPNEVICSIRKRDTADVDDSGWVYIPNVISVSRGSFDVLVAALSGDTPQAAGEFPNETVRLVYTLVA